MKKYEEELGDLLTDKMFFYRQSERDLTCKDSRHTPMAYGLHNIPLRQIPLENLVKMYIDDHIAKRGEGIEFHFMITDQDSIYWPFFVHEGVQAYLIRVRCVNPDQQ